LLAKTCSAHLWPTESLHATHMVINLWQASHKTPRLSGARTQTFEVDSAFIAV